MRDADPMTAAVQAGGARTSAAVRHRLPWRARLSGGTLAHVVLVIVFVLATLLRLDALTGRFGQVSQPAWLQALQSGSQALVGVLSLPVADWEPEPEYPHREGPPTHYRSDPYTYLQRAREMSSFYGAHYREPVFPFVVKLFLWMLNDQDIAVSFASATFSVLCVLATYFMGALAFSRWVGCAAALGMAVEHNAIAWGVAGWRDDAFAFAVGLSICTMLYYRRKPSIGSAVALGASAALACLTRIFSVSFLAPGFFFLLLSTAGSWSQRLRGVMIAALTAMALVAPYLVNCWREFGDPLYTLNAPPTTPSSSDWIRSRLQPTPKTFPRCGSFSTACSSARSPSHGTLRRSGRMSWC